MKPSAPRSVGRADSAPPVLFRAWPAATIAKVMRRLLPELPDGLPELRPERLPRCRDAIIQLWSLAAELLEVIEDPEIGQNAEAAPFGTAEKHRRTLFQQFQDASHAIADQKFDWGAYHTGEGPFAADFGPHMLMLQRVRKALRKLEMPLAALATLEAMVCSLRAAQPNAVDVSEWTAQTTVLSTATDDGRVDRFLTSMIRAASDCGRRYHEAAVYGERAEGMPVEVRRRTIAAGNRWIEVLGRTTRAVPQTAPRLILHLHRVLGHENLFFKAAWRTQAAQGPIMRVLSGAHASSWAPWELDRLEQMLPPRLRTVAAPTDPVMTMAPIPTLARPSVSGAALQDRVERLAELLELAEAGNVESVLEGIDEDLAQWKCEDGIRAAEALRDEASKLVLRLLVEPDPKKTTPQTWTHRHRQLVGFRAVASVAHGLLDENAAERFGSWTRFQGSLGATAS